MDSVMVEVAARLSVPSARRNDGSDVLKSAPARGRKATQSDSRGDFTTIFEAFTRG